MKALAKELVVINLFRWTLGNDKIQRAKYFSNSYNIFEFIQFVKGEFPKVEIYRVLKGQTQGPQHLKETNPLVVRTGDHLVFFCYLNLGLKSIPVENTASELGFKAERFELTVF